MTTGKAPRGSMFECDSGEERKCSRVTILDKVAASKASPADTAEAMEGVATDFCRSRPVSGQSTLASPQVLDISGARRCPNTGSLEPNHRDKVADNGTQQIVWGEPGEVETKSLAYPEEPT